MAIGVFISSIVFQNGTTITFDAGCVTLIVGPNNSGKTTFLREMNANLAVERPGNLIRELSVTKTGAETELRDWLKANFFAAPEGRRYSGPAYAWLGGESPERMIKEDWASTRLGNLRNLVAAMLDVEGRLGAVKPPDPIDLTNEAPTHPLHVVYQNDVLESVIARHFRQAFGTDITLNRGAGKFSPFHYGNRPDFLPSEDRVSPGYVRRLSDLPLLHEQGHGMRSFLGCILHTFTTPALIEFVDEPEAFLHPPQARLLGTLLAKEKPADRQMFIATHSGDVLRGILDAEDSKLQVIRLSRSSDGTTPHLLSVTEIRRLWSDPILRFSNVLDGLFHETVVVTESDSDCRFYAAVMDALRGDSAPRPDVMFSATGGKERIPLVVRALRSVGVKTRAISDFDVLRDQRDIRGCVEALGGNWTDFENEWRIVKNAIEQKSPPLSRHQVQENINTLLDQQNGANLLDTTVDQIRSILKSASPWQIAKLAGTAGIPSGNPREAADSLLEKLQRIGLFVVEVGEIERFAPSIGGHGTQWVSRVLERDLAADPELATARKFISSVLDMPESTPSIVRRRANDEAAPLEPVSRPVSGSKGHRWWLRAFLARFSSK